MPPRAAAGLAALAGEEALRLAAVGDSMRPTIAPGDELVVTAAARPRPGDIVVVRDAGGRLVAHRVLHLRRAEGGFELLTRGDAARSPDRWMPASALVGEVVEIAGRRLAPGAADRLAARFRAARYFLGRLLARRSE
ncbi:MAG: S24/S26 family peptidase [Thermoanaerobaculia bacterium]